MLWWNRYSDHNQFKSTLTPLLWVVSVHLVNMYIVTKHRVFYTTMRFLSTCGVIYLFGATMWGLLSSWRHAIPYWLSIIIPWHYQRSSSAISKYTLTSLPLNISLMWYFIRHGMHWIYCIKFVWMHSRFWWSPETTTCLHIWKYYKALQQLSSVYSSVSII